MSIKKVSLVEYSGAGAEMRAARQALGLTRPELGRALGISATEVYRKETGRCGVSVAQLLALRYLVEAAKKKEEDA